MATHTTQTSIDLPCHSCGYDLRVHPPDGKCPECGSSVAESRRIAAIPRRPTWRQSDPRWRRRILAGTWILVLLPLMSALQTFGWASNLPVPNIFNFPGTIQLNETLFFQWTVVQPLIFCIGVVLLFSKERSRHRAPLDQTRRWGVLSTYITLLLSSMPFLFIAALVLAGIADLFLSMPLKFQPRVTQLFVEVSTTYLRYGPYPKPISSNVLVASSSIAILLACIPLFNALRSSGPKHLAAILLAPLPLFSLMYLAQAAWYCIAFPSMSTPDMTRYSIYFCPELLINQLANLPASLTAPGSPLIPFFIEAVKWCIFLSIAIWLTIAQLATWKLPHPNGHPTPKA